jgi:anti-sigma regulatory factor (Ser/Thr protein kinase)
MVTRYVESRPIVKPEECWLAYAAEMLGPVRLTVPSDGSSLAVVGAVVESFPGVVGAGEAAARRMVSAVCEAVAFVAAEAYPDRAEGQLELTLQTGERSVRVQIHDWGRPLAAAGGELGELPPGLDRVAREALDVRIINLGREGKLTTFSWPLEHGIHHGVRDLLAQHVDVSFADLDLEGTEDVDAPVTHAGGVARLASRLCHERFGWSSIRSWPIASRSCVTARPPTAPSARPCSRRRRLWPSRWLVG